MKFILFILTLLPLITFSQIPDGVYKHATVTVLGGIVSAVDSTQEIDPTVDIDVKNITTSDLNRWNDAATLINTGYPNYTLLDYLINHVWIPQSTDALPEGTTNLYYSVAKFNAALATKTTDNISEGLSPNRKYYSDILARAAFAINSPLTYNSTTGVFGIQIATTSQPGYLSAADFTSFSNKQGVLTSGATIKTLEGISLLGSGNIDLGKADIGLTNVDNTSDATKNVLSATKFTTARNINGQAFDGTSNITIPGSSINGIPNSSLTNNSITINGNNVPLGGSTTVTASPSISAPSANNVITSGVAFQPRSGGPCNILINTNVSGLVGVGSTVVIAMSPTSGGTYTNIANDAVSITVLTLGDKASGLIPVPTGYWVRVTYTAVGLATVSGTYTKWDL